MADARAMEQFPEGRPTDPKGQRTPWELFLSEMIGIGLLLLGGLSLVIFVFGAGSPIVELVPSKALRMAMTGFLFGTIGALIAVSPVGEISGAYINPAVSLGFLLMGKFRPRVAFGPGRGWDACHSSLRGKWAGVSISVPVSRARVIPSGRSCWVRWPPPLG